MLFRKVKMWTLAGVFLLSGSALFAGLQLVEHGKTSYQIVLPAKASDNLKYAAHELKIHLEQASGATFQIVESNQRTGNQILLSEKNPKLQKGEFSIRTEGKTLVLSGGGESGIHHAVHDFLETDCGYIWYDARGGKKVPDLKNFKLGDLDRKKSYAISFRSMCPDYFFYRPEGHYFLYRNGFNVKPRLYPLPGMNKNAIKLNSSGLLAGHNVEDIRRASPADHTFFDYIPDVPGKSRISAFRKMGYFKTKPDYFSMNQKGQRFVRQLCFSNPALRAEFKKNFYTHIRSTPDKNVFSVTAFDFPGQLCYCKECQAAVKKYKANGAPLFLFIKELAEAAAKDFPEVRIFTYAYRKEQTEIPPVGLKFPDNVILCFCPIDDNMSKGWDAAENTKTYQNMLEWKKICKNVWLWYYVNPWTFGVISSPMFGNIYRCANDLVLAHKAGITGTLYSNQIGLAPMVGFSELQSYLFARLMRNPELNIDFLIDDFLKFEYGAAAPFMRKFLNEQEKVARETNVFVKWNAVPGVWKSFIRSKEIVRWQEYFDQMEKLTANDLQKNFSVRRVRLALDIMTLRFYRYIKKDVPEYQTTVVELGNRIKTTGWKTVDSFYSVDIPAIRKHAVNDKKAYERLVNKMIVQEGSEPKSLPKEIFGKIDPARIFEFYPESMRKTVQVKDSNAAWGYAMVNDDTVQGLPLQILEYDEVKPLWEDIAEIHNPKAGMEGKYCFYNIGETSITPSYEMRIHFEGYKHLFRIFPGEVWMPGTDDTVTIYISLKFTGPKYYPGSKEKNSVACDRIVFVRKTND